MCSQSKDQLEIINGCEGLDTDRIEYDQGLSSIQRADQRPPPNPQDLSATFRVSLTWGLACEPPGAQRLRTGLQVVFEIEWTQTKAASPPQDATVNLKP